MVIGIQRDEFGFPVTLEQQPDLIDVIGHYSSGKGGFWIALDNKKLVGSIGLLDLGAGQSSLRKMFVLPEYRGSGVAFDLLVHLIEFAKAKNFNDIYLGTTSKYHAALRFYEKNDFVRVNESDLPNGFPKFAPEDVFCHLAL